MYSELRLDPWIEVALQQKNAGTVNAVPLLSSSPSLCRPLVVQKCNNLKKQTKKKRTRPLSMPTNTIIYCISLFLLFFTCFWRKKLNAGVDLMQQLQCHY